MASFAIFVFMVMISGAYASFETSFLWKIFGKYLYCIMTSDFQEI